MKKINLKNLKALLCVIGIASLIANSMVLYITFLWAYFFNNFVFAVNINTIGEAHLEFFILPASIFLGIYGTINLIKYLPRRQSNVF
jgi:hypothetical protein